MRTYTHTHYAHRRTHPWMHRDTRTLLKLQVLVLHHIPASASFLEAQSICPSPKDGLHGTARHTWLTHRMMLFHAQSLLCARLGGTLPQETSVLLSEQTHQGATVFSAGQISLGFGQGYISLIFIDFLFYMEFVALFPSKPLGQSIRSFASSESTPIQAQ